jgi:hypothetical protein
VGPPTISSKALQIYGLRNGESTDLADSSETLDSPRGNFRRIIRFNRWSYRASFWIRLILVLVETLIFRRGAPLRKWRKPSLRQSHLAKMLTRIRLSLILSAQLYSEAVRILDIQTVRARLHFQTATL